MSEQPTSGGSSNVLIDGVIKFWKELGALAVVLAFYLGQDAGYIANPVEEELGKIHAELQEIKGQGIQHDATMKELTRHVEAQGRQLEDEAKGRQLRCVMRAKTDAEKKSCFPTKQE